MTELGVSSWSSAPRMVSYPVPSKVQGVRNASGIDSLLQSMKILDQTKTLEEVFVHAFCTC